LKVYFKPRPRLKRVITDLDFSTLAIKGRASQGNMFSRYGIHKIVLKEKGASTLGGQNIWFDEEVRRLNADGRGVLLGEFEGDDRIVVFTRHFYYVTGYELTHHFPEDLVRVEKWDPERVYSATYFDEGLRYYYVKRFPAIANGGSQQEWLESDCRLVELVEGDTPRLEVTYQGANAARPADVVDVAVYIGIKSHKAKGKRITTYDVGGLRFLEPLPAPEDDIAPVDESFDIPEPDEDAAVDGAGDEFADYDSPLPVTATTEPPRQASPATPPQEGNRTPSAVPAAPPPQEGNHTPSAALAATSPQEGSFPAPVELEIERAAPVDDTRNPPTEQLNLF
jgi:topoisomerase-4 subunit A